MKKFQRTFLVLALAFVMCFGATACGETTTETIKGVTETTIYVGNTATVTSGGATIGIPFNIGINAAFYAYNQAGGFNGKNVELKHYDDQGKAETSATLMDKLIHEDEVFAIVGNFGTPQVAANLEIIKEARVPMVYAAAGNDILLNEAATGEDRYVFPVQPLNKTEGRMLLVRAFAPVDKGGLGGTKVGVIYDSNEASQSIYKGIKDEAKNLPAEQKENVKYVEVAGGDYSAAATTLVSNEGCDVVLVGVIGTGFTSALVALNNVGFTGKVLTSYNNASYAVFNDATTGAVASIYEPVLKNIEIYSQGWLDTTVPLTDAVALATNIYTKPGAILEFYRTLEMVLPVYNLQGEEVGEGIYGFKNEYWTIAENIYNYYITTDTTANAIALGLGYTANAYALAGYIAGDLFCQGLAALAASGKELTRSNYVDVMESQELKILTSNPISFANGKRAGVETFGLSKFTLIEGKEIVSASSATAYPLMSIQEYRDMLNA